MLRYGKELRRIRKERKLRQIDVAKAIGMSGYSYSSIERGKFLPDSTNVVRLLNSRFYTPEERERLKEVHEISELEFHEKRNNKEYQKKLKKIEEYQSSRKRKKRKEERLIRNMPNFYKELDALGDLSKLDVNDTELQDLREAVSGKRYWKGEGL